MNLQDYQELYSASDVQRFERKLVAFAHHFDFGIVSAAIGVERPGQEAVFVQVGNMPKDFAEAQRDPEDYKRDPVLQRLKSQSVPFAYDQDLYVKEGGGDLWKNRPATAFAPASRWPCTCPAGATSCWGGPRAGAARRTMSNSSG